MKKCIFFVFLIYCACSLEVDRKYPSNPRIDLIKRQGPYGTIEIDLFNNEKDGGVDKGAISKLRRNRVIDIALKYLKSESYDIKSVDIDSGTIKTGLQNVLFCNERYIPMGQDTDSEISKHYGCNNALLLKRSLTIVIKNDGTIDKIDLDFDHWNAIYNTSFEYEKYRIISALMVMEVEELIKDPKNASSIILESTREFFDKMKYNKFNVTSNDDYTTFKGTSDSHNITVNIHLDAQIDVYIENIKDHTLDLTTRLRVVSDIMNRAIINSLKSSGYY